MTEKMNTHTFFDSHLHIIDPNYPLIANNGFMPEAFSVKDYHASLAAHHVIGGAVVSGSFQGFDQDYLIAALKALGPNFVGVTQVPHTVSDQTLLKLHEAGVRALRFNLFRGGSESLAHLESMAKRVAALLDWHVELYLDASNLPELSSIIKRLPAVCIDHLGMRQAGFRDLLHLVESHDCFRVKATGFGRVDFDCTTAVKSIYQANPQALIFGTDLPSTRAPRAFQSSDIDSVYDALGESASQQVFVENALTLYKPAAILS